MRLYLDLCCLKRPFDDQSQSRIATETAAILAINHRIEKGDWTALRSIAHDMENEANPNPNRKAAVREWLAALGAPALMTDDTERSFRRFRDEGLRQMDALHLSLAENLQANLLLTTDDRFIRASSRLVPTLSVRVCNPVTFILEVE